MTKFYYIFILIFFFPFFAHSQAQKIKFEHITMATGLSSNQVNCIIQDSKGFMWFGTENGLNRYDGYNFKVYINDPNDPFSISNNSISSIIEDSFGNLWIGTRGGGLNKFEWETERFFRFIHDSTNINSLPDDFVRSICEDKEGDIWIGTHGGLSRLSSPQVLSIDSNEQAKFITYQHKPDDPTSLSHDRVTTIFEDQSGLLWIGTWGEGINIFDKKTEKFRNYNERKLTDIDAISHEVDFLFGPYVNSIYSDPSDSSKIIWIGTNSRLNKFDRINNKFIVYFNDPNDPYSIRNSYITSICKMKRGLYLIGTGGGLHVFDRRKEKFFQYKNDPDNIWSISHNSVNCIYEDRTGRIWVGTGGGGVNKIDEKKNQFKRLKIDLKSINIKSNCNITSVHEDKDADRHILWIGSFEQGLIKYDRATGQIIQYKQEFYKPDLNGYCQIQTIFQDKNNADIIWIGSLGGGLHRFDKKNEMFSNHNLPPRLEDFDNNKKSVISTFYLNQIIMDKSGLLWLITLRGFYSYNREKEQFTPYLHDPENPNSISENWLMSICEDRLGNLWIGTLSQGLNKFDPNTNIFSHYKNISNDSTSLNSNKVYSIFVSRDGTLWIGTDNGLNKFNSKTETFIRYMKRNELLGVEVWGILEDDHGNLWLNTSKGLARFNPKTASVRYYDEKDGVEASELNSQAYHKSESGEMFFGGPEGINVFYPDSIKDNSHIPPIVLTDFQIFNLPVKPGKDSPLKKSISAVNEITMSYKQSVFSFEFAALDYTNPEKNNYAYKMEGVDPNWVFTDATRRFVTYTQLNPGKYIFRVKGSNSDDVWNDEGTSVQIIITPPWWRTLWAYILYGVIFLSILVSTWQLQLRRIKIRNELKMKNFETQKLHEIDSMKSRFFANISHEFRTPLTLILGPISKMFEKAKDQETKQELNMMQRNARRLQRLINQLLDLSKIEEGKMTLQARPESIVALLNRIVQSFESQAKLKGIELKFHSELDEIIAYIDRDKIENVFYNLLSNALKFTPEGGTVACEIQFVNLKSEIVISVNDTGIGIPPDRLDKIFNRFYQVDDSYTREHEGSGIGLALTKELVDLHHGKIKVQSELNKSTTFTVYLPLGKKHLKPEEIAAKSASADSEPSGGFPEESSEDTESARSDLRPSEGFTPPSKNRKALPLVLIVEDNPDMRSYMQDCLASDYRVIEAVDGEDGLHRAIDKIPDLIISDVMMPRMDGFELCGRLKSDERTSHIPVILLTARASAESKIKGLELGADDYLIKPFDRTELLVRSKNLIEQRRKLRERFSRDISLQPKEIAGTSYDEKFLQRTMDIIEQHLTDSEFTVNMLLKEVGMSRMQLHRKLRALINCSASEFIRVLRLKRAAQLLQQKSGNVTEVAFEVGFNNLSYFSRCFRQQFGKLPSEYTPMKH